MYEVARFERAYWVNESGSARPVRLGPMRQFVSAGEAHCALRGLRPGRRQKLRGRGGVSRPNAAAPRRRPQVLAVRDEGVGG